MLLLLYIHIVLFYVNNGNEDRTNRHCTDTDISPSDILRAPTARDYICFTRAKWKNLKPLIRPTQPDVGYAFVLRKVTDIKIYTKIMKIYNAFNECNSLTDHQILFKIIHIKSHVATVINGNDLADILAKAAMLKLSSLSNNANNNVKTITKDIYHGNERSYKSVANDNKRHFITQNQSAWHQHMT
eukprot:960533_1